MRIRYLILFTALMRFVAFNYAESSRSKQDPNGNLMDDDLKNEGTSNRRHQLLRGSPANTVDDLLRVLHAESGSSSKVPPRKPQRLCDYMKDLYDKLTELSKTTNYFPMEGQRNNVSERAVIKGLRPVKAVTHWNGSYDVWFEMGDDLVRDATAPHQAELVLTSYPSHHKTWTSHHSNRGRYRRWTTKTDDDNDDEQWRTMVIRSGRNNKPRLFHVLNVTSQLRRWIVLDDNFRRNNNRWKVTLSPLSLDTLPQHSPKPFLVLYYGVDHRDLLQSPAAHAARRPSSVLRREERSASSAPTTSSLGRCQLHDWYVSFSELGWDTWVLAPGRLHPNFCAGECPAIMMQAAYNASLHAILRGIYVSSQPLDSGILLPPSACCVPTRLKSANLMYLEKEMVVIRRLEGIIAEECGCL